MKKIIAVLVVVSFFLMSCAHTSQPYKTPAKDEIKPTEEKQSDEQTLPKEQKEKKKKGSQWFGPTEQALLFIVVIGVLVGAFIYGAKKSMDDLGEFNFNALYP